MTHIYMGKDNWYSSQLFHAFLQRPLWILLQQHLITAVVTLRNKAPDSNHPEVPSLPTFVNVTAAKLHLE